MLTKVRFVAPAFAGRINCTVHHPWSEIVIKPILIGVVALLASNAAFAVYRCVDGDTRRITYQDFSCDERRQPELRLASNTAEMNLRGETRRTIAQWSRDSVAAESQRENERMDASARLSGQSAAAASRERGENIARISRAQRDSAGHSLYPRGLREINGHWE